MVKRRALLLHGSQLLILLRCLCYKPASVTPLWQQQWTKIEDMRKHSKAAVDTMGADALAKRDVAHPIQFRFQTLIATMLSPQTRDEQTTAAYENLRGLVPSRTLTATSLAGQPLKKVEEAMRPVSFYKVKAVNILEASKICVNEYDGDIPSRIEDLLKFKGVGPKIAYLTFTIAWNKTLGICVDTHVHRIANRLGWVETADSKSKATEKTRVALEKVLPEDKWADVNGLLVGFGQTICTARAPKCSQCIVSDSCKYFQSTGRVNV
jgi:endonuclease-3